MLRHSSTEVENFSAANQELPSWFGASPTLFVLSKGFAATYALFGYFWVNLPNFQHFWVDFDHFWTDFEHFLTTFISRFLVHGSDAQ